MKKQLILMLTAFAGLFAGSNSTHAEEKSTSPYTGITIEEAAGRTDLFLYNVESGYWLQENNRQRGSWNTRGNLDAHGFDVEITAIDGGYQINPKFNHNKSMNGSNWYLDTGDDVTAWTFNPITKEGVSNAYQIKYGSDWLHATPETDNFYLIRNNVEARATWQIVTLAERLTYLQENATEDNPLDATFLIQAFDLANEDSRMSSWGTAQDGGNSDWNRADDGDNGYRCLRAHGYWNTKTCSYTQTIANVPDGIYEFYCTGFYRDGNRDQCQERRLAGTETIRGFMVLNDERAPLKSILDGAQASSGNGFGYHNESYDYGYFPDGGDDVTRAFVSTPNAYLNDPVRATVVGGNIRLGIEKTEYTGGSDWVFFSRFRLRYLGPIDISEYTDALNEAIKQAEAFTGNTTTALAANLATALAEAKAVVDSHDTDVLSEKTGNLINALNAAKAVDVTVLSATVPLAEAEGIDVTAAEYFLENGTEKNDDLLFSLQCQRKMKAMRYFDDATIAGLVGSEPQDGVSYYLLNVGTGMFFACNSDWGTHMALDSKGFLVKLIAVGTTSGLTDYHVSGTESVGWDGFNWTEEYFDKNGESKWHFVPVEGKTNVYNFAIYDNHAWHIVYDPNNLTTDGDKYFNVLKKLNSTGYESDPNAQWILLTPAQRTALLANATADNPIDATHLIENPNFNKSKASGSDDTKYGWTGIGTVGNYGRYADYVAEFFETTADAKTEVTGLPAGKYRVSMSGFYREKGFANDISVYKGGEIYSDHAHLVAYTDESNQVSAPFMHVSAEHGKLPGVGTAWEALDGDMLPYYMSDAAQYFETGLYRITTDVINVGKDGTLTIGVVKPSSTGNDGNWIVFDNLRLTCLGLTDYVDVSDALYATYVAPFDVDFTGAEVSAFAAQKTNKDNYTYIDLEEVTTVPAGTAVVVKAEAAGSYVVAKTTGAALGTENDLMVSDEDVTTDGTQYILADGPRGVGFYKASATIPAGKGYIEFSGEATVKDFYGFDADDATGISDLNGSWQEADGQTIYNVAGQRIGKMQKGVNIVGGKKALK